MSILTNIGQLKLDLVLAAHRLAEPLDQLQSGESSESEINLPNGPDLLLGELMMVALMFSSSDNEIAESEIALINEISQAVKGVGADEISSTNFMQVYRQFVADYPGIKLSLDNVPLSIHRLKEFDEDHGTTHVEDAKLLFLDFASAIVRADGEVREREKVALANFELMLSLKIDLLNCVNAHVINAAPTSRQA
jgi:tellurite resistance protein